ncbi:MAG: IS1 family transposase [Chitinophagaceae bacterium]
MNCPKCGNDKYNRDGFVKGVQRYKCKNCAYKYTVELKSTAKPKSMKKQALHLYLEGLGFRSIGRFLGVSNVSVLNWIRSFGEEIASLRTESEEIEMVELDEMHSYVGSKKYCWIWIAVDRLGKRFISFVVGDRGNKTAERLWDEIKHHEMTNIATDYWKPYEHIVPTEKHIESKAATFTVEGHNSLFRHFLARMRRKSKCYSKKVEMLKLSILLLMHHRNNTLTLPT